MSLTAYEPYSTLADTPDDMRGMFSITESFGIDSDVTIVGFPILPIAPPESIPMTKIGAVASSPSTGLLFQGRHLPAFYLDALTRPGFSGSLVFCRSTGTLFEKKDDRVVNLRKLSFGPRYSFLGIYSSRVKEVETKEPIYGVSCTKDGVEAVCGNEDTPDNPAILSPGALS